MPLKKIALVKHGKGDTLQDWYSWCDGLYGAMKLMAEKVRVHVYGYAEISTTFERDGVQFSLVPKLEQMQYWLESYNPDVIFGWGVSFHNWQEINNLSCKKILLYAGGEPDKENAKRLFDEIVVENDTDAKFFDTEHVAFGTNTDIFKPIKLNKLYPCFYPASFALWKRHNLWAKSVPTGSLAVGQFQEHEKECYDVVIDKGHLVLPATPMTLVPYLYNQSLGVCLTAERMGGCQRAALEAMACNIPVLVTNDSKASEFEGVWTCPANSTDIANAYSTMVASFELEKPDLRKKFIMGKYDHKTYFEKLFKLI